MKRITLSVLSLLLILLFAVGCGKKDEIIGKWVTEYESDELQGNISLVYEFAENNKLYVSPVNSENIDYMLPFGEYEIEKDKIILISDSERAEYTFSVKQDVLILESSDGNITFEKVK